MHLNYYIFLACCCYRVIIMGNQRRWRWWWMRRKWRGRDSAPWRKNNTWQNSSVRTDYIYLQKRRASTDRRLLCVLIFLNKMNVLIYVCFLILWGLQSQFVINNIWFINYFCCIVHYKDEVYDAVLTSTYKSLAALAESSGCEGDVIRAISAMSHASSDHQGTPRSPRMHSAHSRVSSALSEKSRPQTSLSQLSNMTWTTERTNEVTYLQ